MDPDVLLRPFALLMEYRMYLLAVSGFLIAGAAVTYGLRTEDTVMALGALLFLPNALVLLGVGLRERGWFDEGSPITPE
ncbi:hypothetical protein [Halonotius sp. GCM10025705]|uniref:hypothetical protein n=1 Tax=Halonotius sp. GCM10025705 TaxID=3252678 RepID=UPI00361626F3